MMKKITRILSLFSPLLFPVAAGAQIQSAIKVPLNMSDTSIRNCLFYSFSSDELILACKMTDADLQDGDLLIMGFHPDGSLKPSPKMRSHQIDSLDYKAFVYFLKIGEELLNPDPDYPYYKGHAGLLAALAHAETPIGGESNAPEFPLDGATAANGVQFVLTTPKRFNTTLNTSNPEAGDTLSDLYYLYALDPEGTILWNSVEDLFTNLWPQINYQEVAEPLTNPQTPYHLMKWVQAHPHGGAVVYGQARWSAKGGAVPAENDKKGSFLYCYDDQGKYVDGLTFNDVFVTKNLLTFKSDGRIVLVYDDGPVSILGYEWKHNFVLAYLSANCNYQNVEQIDFSFPTHFPKNSGKIKTTLLGSLTDARDHHFILYLQQLPSPFPWQDDPDKKPTTAALKTWYQTNRPGLFVLELNEGGKIIRDYAIIPPGHPDSHSLISFASEPHILDNIQEYSLSFSMDQKSILIAFHNPAPGSPLQQPNIPQSPFSYLEIYRLPITR